MAIRKHSAGSLEAETLRQKIGDETLLWAFFPLEEDDGARPEFIDDLAAGAAGRARNSVIVGDGDGLNLEFPTALSDGRKDRGTLSAVRHSVRRVLNVTSHEDLALRGEDSRTHSEVGEGRIGVPHYFARRAEQTFAHGRWHFCLLHTQANFAQDRVVRHCTA